MLRRLIGTTATRFPFLIQTRPENQHGFLNPSASVRVPLPGFRTLALAAVNFSHFQVRHESACKLPESGTTGRATHHSPSCGSEKLHPFHRRPASADGSQKKKIF